VCNTEPLREAAPAAVNLNLLLVEVPNSIVKFKVNPIVYVRRFASDDFNPSALLLSARNPIQDVGLIYQAIIPQAGWHFLP
jgi:hypothetical protein